MAKTSGVNIVEQHAEKIVLAVCVLFLVYGMSRWAFSSPCEIEISGPRSRATETFGPDLVDEELLTIARDIERKVQQVEVQQYPPPTYREKLQTYQAQPFRALGQLADFGEARAPAEEMTDGGKQGKAQLKNLVAGIPQPSKPLVVVERELLRQTPPKEVVAAHVAVTYPWGELTRRWTEQLAETRIYPKVISLKVQAEIRQRRPDGTWGPAEVVDTVQYSLDSSGREISPPALLEYDGTNGLQIQQIKDQLGEEWQQEILEPGYWNIRWPTHEWGTWQIHLADNPVSKAYATEETPAVAAARPKPTLTPRSTRESRIPTPSPRTPSGSTYMPTMGPGGMPLPPGGPGGFPSPGMTGPTRQQPRRPRTTQRPTRRPTRRPTPARPLTSVAEEIPAPEPTLVPPLEEQILTGTVLVWLHDTGLKSLTTYQYRIRVAFVNPLLTYSTDVENEDDAKQAMVWTPFSDWSVPVSVPQTTEFFLTGGSATQGYVYVSVFTRKWGQWISQRFRVNEGEMIGGKEKFTLTDPDGNQKREEVDFSTGAMAVRFDFNKTVQIRNMERKTVEMVYLNRNNQLRTRVRMTDQRSSRHEQLKKEAERTEAAARTLSAANR